MAQLPTGTVIFLFTDIEGSTSRWEHQPTEMRQALAQHDRLLRQVIEAHGGVVFKTVGDSFYAAFAVALDALEAALSVQRLLQAEPWELIEPLRVRMAIHAGTAEERDGDYFGPPLNRVARLLAAGHGGQILLSLVGQELLHDHLPSSVKLLDLGQHQLKDLIRAEHIFQVVHPDLPADFLPLKTLTNRPTNLPSQLTPFIGREQELAAVKQLLSRSDVRLLTLTGPGGTGKTRLSLQVAAEASDEFVDGVFFVPLASVADPGMVAAIIAQSLRVKARPDASLVQSLQDYLHDKSLLLVLDNFEQILAAAPLINELLVNAPYLKILVTSRSVLRIYGEHEFQVMPLALPDLQYQQPLTVFSQYAAVALFIERAQAIKPDFVITNANAPAVAEICVRLDGLPLAIELAAARIKLFTPEAMLPRLTNRLKLLTSGARDLPLRQQTLRDAIDWSYNLLSLEEQRLFAQLTVFVGGCSLEAAEIVCSADQRFALDILDGLESLCDKSLLRREETPAGDIRFMMLEVLHEYGREQHIAMDESALLQQQHAMYYAGFAEAAEQRLNGSEQTQWLDRLEQEHDNLRAALSWAIEHHDFELANRLGVALWRFWYARGYLNEGRCWLKDVLAIEQPPSLLQGKAFNGAGILAWAQGDYVSAHTYLARSLELMRERASSNSVGILLNNIGLVFMDQGDYDQARSLFQESLDLARTHQNQRAIGLALTNLASVARFQRDYATAGRCNEESLALWRTLGDQWSIATVLANFGYLLREQEDHRGAQTLYEESLAIRRNLKDREGIAECLEGLAWVAVTDDQAAYAARLCCIAELLRAAIGAPLQPVARPAYEATRAIVYAKLDEAAFAQIQSEVEAMSIDQIMVSL